MKIYSTILSLIALSAISSVHAEGNIEHGQKIFNRSCALCHGKQAEKSAMGQSQIVNTLSQEKIITSLQDRERRIKRTRYARCCELYPDPQTIMEVR